MSSYHDEDSMLLDGIDYQLMKEMRFKDMQKKSEIKIDNDPNPSINENSNGLSHGSGTYENGHSLNYRDV